jgi:hypothetical protein
MIGKQKEKDAGCLVERNGGQKGEFGSAPRIELGTSSILELWDNPNPNP